MRCKHCGHSADAHVNSECAACGCVRLELRDKAPRAARLRTWIATAEFFTRRGWVKAPEVRVKAMGHSGAAMRAVREAKALALKPRTRVAQVRLTLVPVPKRRGGER